MDSEGYDLESSDLGCKWAVDKGGRCVDTYGVINKNCEVALLQRDWFMRKSVLTAAIFVVCHGGQRI